MIENLEIALHKYVKFIFDKGAKHINRGRIVFSINGAGVIGHSNK